MTTLTAMRGYPGSGKSTIARTLPGVVVGRDYLRKQLFGQYVVGNDHEDVVTIAQQAQVRALLAAGRSVIVDDMNVNPRYLRDWAKVARDLGVEFEVWDVHTSVETCIARDRQREPDKVVGESVIRKIAKRFPMEKWPTITLKPKPTAEIVPYVANPNTPPAIIVDIDGTLAHMDGKRSPYDYDKVSGDSVDEAVRGLVNLEWAKGTIVIVCSGRDSDCYDVTQKWLIDNGVSFDVLLMRDPDDTDGKGNKLPDWIVKLGIFNNLIRDDYSIKYVLDDRDQVVRTWRALGLKCLQVQPGDF